MKNESNLVKYRLLAPVYDLLFRGPLRRARKQAISSLHLTGREGILIVGVGTGEDLPILPASAPITGIDISEAMLQRARQKAGNRNITFREMYAEHLDFPNQTFDAVILNLILSVVEDPHSTLSEALRVLKPGGRVLVFDKFVPDGRKPGLGRKVLNKVTSLIGTDITRRFEDIAEGLPINIAFSQWVLAGLYRIMVLEGR